MHVLGWPKVHSRFFCNIVQKNTCIFGQPNIVCLGRDVFICPIPCYSIKWAFPKEILVRTSDFGPHLGFS